MILSDQKKIINKVLVYLFENPTNTFFQKSWWNSLSDETKHAVLSYHDDELHAFPDKVQSDEGYRIFIPEFLPTNRFNG